MSHTLSKQDRLEATIARIHQQHGIQALIKGQPSTALASAKARGGTFRLPLNTPHIPTGFPALDEALIIGGLPKGRLNELVGPATSGKTTLVLKFLARAQKDGGQVGYVDQAHALDPDYAHRCGLDLSRLLVAAPHDLKEALAITEALAGSGGLEAMVFDGPDSLWNDSDSASSLAACLDRLVAPVARSGTALLFLRTPSGRGAQDGQIQDPPLLWGPALRALAHHATVRLGIVREQWLRSHGDIGGYSARVEVLKNRLGPAGRAVSITITFNGTEHGNGL
jgi:recombination protein RecA